MKKLREMKKNNKGFSLVELIVVIAIMVVLIAVLGSTILGYVEKSKYSKDIQALDSVKTAISTFVADPEAKYDSGEEYTLAELMDTTKGHDPNSVISKTLKEVFNGTDFNNSSVAFEGTNTSDVKVTITDGAVYIEVPSKKPADYKDYTAGVKPGAAVTPTTPTT